MPHDAVRTYHDLLTPDLAAATQGHLDEQQRRRGLSSAAGRSAPSCGRASSRRISSASFNRGCAC